MADFLSAPHSLKHLREGFAFVAANADLVSIDHEALARFANELPAYQAKLQDRFFDPFNHFQPRAEWGNVDEQFYAYTLTLNAANFGSALREDLRASGFIKQGEGLYYPFARAMTRWFEANEGKITPTQLSALNEQDVAHIFGFRAEIEAEAYLTKRFTKHLNMLGNHVAASGDFRNYVLEQSGNAAGFAVKLASPLLSAFKDSSSYKGQEISFLKRAQICASDIAWKRDVFGDLSELTVFLDDQVPHVLRMAGILTYAPALAAKVDSNTLLPEGGAEEVEIRAVAGHACELLAQKSGFTARDIDPILWHLGHDADGLKHKSFRPHRCLTAAY